MDSDGLTTLSPRRSFALWRDEKRGISEPWWPEELRVATELRRAVVELVLKKVREIARANTALVRSNVELEDFAYIAGHDLKEPLRGIQVYAEMLLRSLGTSLNTSERQRFDMLISLSRRMSGLIDSLLEYSQVGQLDLVREDVDLHELVTSLVAMMKPLLDKQGVTIRLPKPLPRLSVDPVRVRELFQNLITNAAKYNDKADKWIEIGFEDTSPVTIFVRDNGIGIAPRHHASIFQIFRRLHGPDQFGGGSGAGLTIAQKIVERHHGKLSLASAPDEGSTFSFTLEPGAEHVADASVAQP